MRYFEVTPECLQLGLRSAALIFSGVRIEAAPPPLQSLVREEARRVRALFSQPAQIRSRPEIEKLHGIFRQVGANPRRLQPACERLLLHLLKKGSLPEINNLVDASNLMSVRTFCSQGAHDLSKLALPVTLRRLSGQEDFQPPGGSQPAVQGEFGYVDARQRLICRLDVVQAEFSRVGPDSSDVLLILGATTAHRERLEEMVHDSAALISQFCGGRLESVWTAGAE